jgi:hypothetical protein
MLLTNEKSSSANGRAKSSPLPVLSASVDAFVVGARPPFESYSVHSVTRTHVFALTFHAG